MNSTRCAVGQAALSIMMCTSQPLLASVCWSAGANSTDSKHIHNNMWSN